MNTIDVITDHLYTAKSLYENSVGISDNIIQLTVTKNDLIDSLIVGLDRVVEVPTHEIVMNFIKGKASLNTSILRILANSPKKILEKREVRVRTKKVSVYEFNKMNNRLYSSQICVDALRSAAKHYGFAFTVIQYESYREKKLKEINYRIPSSRTITKYLGYWKGALRKVQLYS